MPVGAEDLGWLLDHVAAGSPETREEAAATAVDWEPAMTDFEKRAVVRLLSLMASTERPGRVREAQLNAVGELFLPPFMTRADVALLFEIPVDTLDLGETEHLDGLREALAGFS